MQFNITFKTIFEYVLKKLVLCIQIRFVSTEKTTRIASRASCSFMINNTNYVGEVKSFLVVFFFEKTTYCCRARRLSVRPSVCPSVRPSVRPSVCRLWK